MHRPFSRHLLLGPSILLLASQALAQPGNEPRPLAPGVLTVVAPAPQESETMKGPVPLKNLPTLDFTPNFSPKEETLFERAKSVTFRRPIWSLEFAFKPLRMTVASVPQPSGKLARRQVLYMVYRIRNNGKALHQSQQADGTFKTEAVSTASLGNTNDPRFVPHFVIVGTFFNETTQKYEEHSYLDQVMPGALPTILARENIPPAKPMLKDADGNPLLGPNGKPLVLLNSAQIAQVHPIPVTTDTDDNSLWGVVTWEIDARIDYLTIYVQGLTNAFRYKVSDDGKTSYSQKTLQMNFWRPGDSWEEAQDPIYFGVPLVKDQLKQVEILEFYHVPGPTLTVYETVEVLGAPLVLGGTGELTNLHRRLVDVEIPVDDKLEVPLRDELDDPGRLPAIVRQKLAEVGLAISDPGKITVETPKYQWNFSATVDGKRRLFRIQYDPQFWDVFNGRVEFRERVEHLWVYR